MSSRILLVVSFFLSFLPGRSQEQTLDYFLQQGIKNSPLIRDLNGQIRSNRIDSLLIKAMNKPRVEFRGYAFYAPVVNNFGYSEILTNIANLTSVMSVSQQLFNKKTVEANLLKTGIQKQSLANTVRLTENSLKKAITAVYIDAWSINSDISVNLELVSFAKEQAKILKSLTENGIYKQTDYLSFMFDLQGQELQVRELNLRFRKQISDLYILCGIRDTASFSPVKPELGNPSPSKQVLLPLFMRFYLDSLRITNENILIDRNYKPTVSWFSDAGLINNDPKVIYQNFGLSLGLNFTLPIYDGNQRKLNHQKRKSEEDIRAGYAEAFNREYHQQLQQLLDELDQTRALLPAIRSQVRNAELLVNQEKELVSKGSGSITDYLIAVKNYLSVRKSLNQYEIRLLQIQNEINYLKQ
ncbi:MAG TPA: TolC family protein [Bacteroidales bacterium]|nr:TolC family protein [Bacteroidales bacterium]